MMTNIDKSKLVLVHNTSDFIQDLPLETKEIGYYKDSWNRFKKSKVSVVAFVIIMVILSFVIVGPHLKIYTLPKTNTEEAARLGYLTPKIPLIEKLGIYDGSKTITKGKLILNAIANSEFGEGVILSGMPQELIDDVNHPDYADVSQITVKVDYYKYVNFIRSYIPEDYFAIISDPTYTGNPLQAVIRNISQEEYETYLAKNYIIDIISIDRDVDSNNNITYRYNVRYDNFKVALDQAPDDTYFWLGTTAKGKDLFTEIWKGARISLLMALAVLMVNSFVGLTLGSVVGYYGGVLDLVFDRFVEIISSIPFLPVLTLLTLRFGNALWVIVLAFTATGWIGSYGTGRMQFYRFKNREYVLAARTLGASDSRIMFKHIFPNTLGLIITGMALSIPSFVFTEASYSFLGIINYSNATSVGMLIQEGQSAMQLHPHLLIYPSVYIAIMMIAFNLFGNGLRDAFNPSLRGVE